MARKRTTSNKVPQTGKSKEAKTTLKSSPSNGSPKGDSPESEDKGKTDIENKGDRPSCNDPEWYSRDNQLVIDAASLPYSDPVGSPLPFGEAGTVIANGNSLSTPTYIFYTDTNNYSLGGICTIKTKASFGKNEDIKSPLNVAAQLLYTHVRYMNSGRKNYDPADLMIYVASMADIYSFITWVQRIYAKAFVYSQQNKYIGKALLEAENIDSDDIVANLANLRYWVNTYINKIASFAVPADIPYFQRRAWIYNHIYIENPDSNIKDQLYQFTPDGFYRFNLDSNSAGMLQYGTFAEIGISSSVKFADIVKIGDWLLQYVFGDEDFGLMSGDIVKAFDGRIIGLAPLPEEALLLPVYSEYVLLQIKNGTIFNVYRGISNVPKYSRNNVAYNPGDVFQDTNGNLVSREYTYQLTTSTQYPDPAVVAGSRHVFTVPTPTPNPIDNMEISRLNAVGIERAMLTAQGNPVPVWELNCGADIMVEASFLRFEKVSGTISLVSHNIVTSGLLKGGSGNFPYELATIMAGFKYAPLLYTYETKTISGVTGTTICNVSIFGNIDNYTLVDQHTVSKMHEVAMLSLLSVPGVAKLIS